MLTPDEEYLVQTTNVSSFLKFMAVVWRTYPDLKFRDARNKAHKLWIARKEWVQNLEPTMPRDDQWLTHNPMSYPPLPPSPVNEL